MKKSNIRLSAIILFAIICCPGISRSQVDTLSTLDIMNMSLQELMQVKVVTADKTRQKISQVPASTIIISRDEIERSGYMSLEEILQYVPGFYGVNDYCEGGTMFGVRGFWSGVPNENIIILINNIPQTKNAFSNHALDQIPVPVESIDRIEIVRGPMSIIYGSGAFLGAVNIITNEEKPTGSCTQIMGGYGGGLAFDPEFSVGMHSEYPNGSGNIGKLFFQTQKSYDDFRFSAVASYYNTKGMDYSAADLMTNSNNLENFGLDSSYTTGQSLGKEFKFFNISAEMSDFYFNAVLVESMTGNHFSIPAMGEGNENNYSDYNFALGYTGHINDNLAINTKLIYFKDRTWFKYHFMKEDFYGMQQLETQAVQYDLDMEYTPFYHFRLTGGISHKSILDAYNMFDVPSFEEDFFNNNYVYLDNNDNIMTSAVYLQGEYNIDDKFLFIAGARLEKAYDYDMRCDFSQETASAETITGVVEKPDVNLIPRLAAIWSIDDSNILKLMYGNSIKRSSFFQDYSQLSAGRPPLEQAEIHTVELNYETILFKNYSLSVNLFHNTLQNMPARIILLDSIGNYDDSYFSNAGKIVTNGMELTVSAKPVHSLHAEFSLTYQSSSDKQSGHEDIDVAFSPNLLGYFKCIYKVTEGFTATVMAKYTDAMHSFWDDSQQEGSDIYVPVGRVGPKAQAWFRTDLNLRYNNLLMQGMFIDFRIVNMFNEEIRYPIYTNNRWINKGTLGISRTIFFSLGYKF